MEATERELDTIIVRNIGDLEASMKRARNEIDGSLNAAAWETLKQALGEDEWYFADGDDPDDSWFAPRDWLAKDENGDEDSDPWFRLKPLESRRGFQSWLAHYAAPKSDRQQISIVWCWHRFYVKDYNAAADASEIELQAIRDLGFHQDGRELFYPIRFDTEMLAEGFAEGDLKPALEPIGHAAAVLKRAQKSFTSFRKSLLRHAR